MSMELIASYLAVGIIAGIIAGLLGLGGGIVIVPALLFLFIRQGFPASILMHLAVATSLATIVVTALTSTWAHHRHGAVLWNSVKLLVPGIILGSLLGAAIADSLPSDNLRVAFGVFECLVAAQIGFGFRPSPQRDLPGSPGMFAAGSGIGTLSTILGIGGGTLTVPFLLWCNVNIRNAVATSAACGFPIALAGSIAMILTGLDHPDLPVGSTGYVYWPAALSILVASALTAPLGVRLAHVLPVKILRRIFAIVLAIIGLRMLL